MKYLVKVTEKTVRNTFTYVLASGNNGLMTIKDSEYKNGSYMYTIGAAIEELRKFAYKKRPLKVMNFYNSLDGYEAELIEI